MSPARSTRTTQRLLALPSSIREVIEFTPKCAIHISSVNDTSFANKAKALIEYYTAFEWDWWPLISELFLCHKHGVIQHSKHLQFCEQRLYKEISPEEAESAQEILGLIGDHPSKCFCCETEAHRIN
jgi:hypothetical protein